MRDTEAQGLAVCTNNPRGKMFRYHWFRSFLSEHLFSLSVLFKLVQFLFDFLLNISVRYIHYQLFKRVVGGLFSSPGVGWGWGESTRSRWVMSRV